MPRTRLRVEHALLSLGRVAKKSVFLLLKQNFPPIQLQTGCGSVLKSSNNALRLFGRSVSFLSFFIPCDFSLNARRRFACEPERVGVFSNRLTFIGLNVRVYLQEWGPSVLSQFRWSETLQRARGCFKGKSSSADSGYDDAHTHTRQHSLRL